MEANNIFKRKNMEKEEQKKSEGRIQAEAYQWFNNTYDHLRGLLYHVPNGEFRDKITANKLKAMGVVAGIPDIVLHFRSRTYFFEFKKPGESPSPAQIKIHAQLDLQRFVVYLVDNLSDFQMLVDSILHDTSEHITLGISKEDFFYRHSIFSYLYDLNDGQIFSVEDLSSEETRKKFIYFVTEFITEGFDQLEGFRINFTPDYKYIYKKLEGSNTIINYNGAEF